MKAAVNQPSALSSLSVLVIDANQRSALATVRSLGSKGVRVQTADDTAQVTHQFPMILKPALSKVLSDGQWHSTRVRVAEDRNTLATMLASNEDYQHPIMVQQSIEAQGQGILTLYNHGEAVCFFAHRRLREKPPWGGVSVLSESVEPNPRTLELSKQLLDHDGWHGVAMVEFKVADDGTHCLMEVNARLWGSLQLTIGSGADFPYLLYQIASGHQPSPNPSIQIGRRLRWLLGVLDSLYIYLRDKRYNKRDKMLRLCQFFIPDFRTTQHEVYRASDPRAGRYELKQYLAALRS